MKRAITIVAALVFVLAFVTAFADEMPILTTESRDAGTLLYVEAPGHAYPTAKKDFSGPIVEEKLVDSGTALYESAFETRPVRITGMAAGGVAREDENTRIWDNLMGPPGGNE
jgi:hypothetical protein